MKKLLFLIVGLTYSLTTTAQKIALSNKININLPSKSEKLSKDQILAFVNERFKNDEIALTAAQNTNPDHTYVADNVLVTLFYGNKSVNENYLLQTKKGLDEMSRKDKSYTSSIETIKNNKVLVINQTAGNVGYYHFYCYDNKNSSAVNGRLEFNIADKAKATKILSDILNGVEFAK